AAIDVDEKQWLDRLKRAQGQIAELDDRAGQARTVLAELALMPQQIEDRRKKLFSALQAAEDAVAQGEARLRQAEAQQRKAQELLSTSRGEHGRSGALVEAAEARLAESTRRIAEALACSPQEVADTAGFDPDAMPPQEEIERKLVTLKDDRDRLGVVNLMAEDEARAVQTQLDGLIRERDDLVQAIGKLRGGIQSLNKEGRQRL